MRQLKVIDEFRLEAKNALFTRQQAMAAAIQLLRRELAEGDNSPEDTDTLKKAIQKMGLRYLDETETQTDVMLEALGVPRLTTDDILKAVNDVLFDVG